MQIHERYFVVERARNKVIMAVLDVLSDLSEEDDVTNIELAMILSALPNDLALKYALREERHGTDVKKADEA